MNRDGSPVGREIAIPARPHPHQGRITGSTWALALTALGVVFGDIGTSPLYTLKTVLNLTGAHPPREVVLGALSLILWTLIIVTTVKYVNIAMRIDNDGEGGIIALMPLLGIKTHRRRSSSPSGCSARR